LTGDGELAGSVSVAAFENAVVETALEVLHGGVTMVKYG